MRRQPTATRTAAFPALPRIGVLALGVLGIALIATGVRGEAHGETFTNDAGETVIRTHGYNFYGELNYPKDFAHFSYVNPDAVEVKQPFNFYPSRK